MKAQGKVQKTMSLLSKVKGKQKDRSRSRAEISQLSFDAYKKPRKQLKQGQKRAKFDSQDHALLTENHDWLVHKKSTDFVLMVWESWAEKVI
jgi:hypothetical protein